MKISIAMILTKAFAYCPKCDSQVVGMGAGSLFIDDNEFVRGCKCGYEIKISIQEKEKV